jgi:hypothetical protein
VSASKRVLYHGSIVAVLASLVALAVALVVPAHAASVFTVDDASDAPDSAVGDGVCATAQGRCTLRAAVQEADAAAGSEVVIPKGLGPIRLTVPSGAEAVAGSGVKIDGAAGDLDVSGTITVTGAGPFESVIDGAGAVRVFDVHRTGTLKLKGVELANGKADFDGDTGHVHGGAIHNHGTLHVANTAIHSSSASAQGWGGGGITNAAAATATLENVTIARNDSVDHGGGIENLGTMSITNVTVTDNRAPAFRGGGIWATGITSVTNSIVALNSFGADCSTANSAIRSLGHNLEGDGTCVFPQPSDLKGPTGFDFGAAPRFYGLEASSQAVDAGDPQSCPTQDVRGVARPQDGNGDGTAACDIGSFEREAASPAREPDPAPAAEDPAPRAQDDDPALSIRDAAVDEGDAAARQARFTVSLSSAATRTTTVRVATADRTARAGSDYRTRSVLLTFRPGIKTKTFVVTVLGDTRAEADETFRAKLSSPSGATIDDGRATGRIRDND